MKRILYDLSYTQNAKFYSGLYEYGKKILNYLIMNTDAKITVILKNEEIDPWILEEKKSQRIDFLMVSDNKHRFLKEIKKTSSMYDLAFFPYQLTSYKIRLDKRCDLIFTIHDVIQLKLSRISKLNLDEKKYIQTKKKRYEYYLKQILRFFLIWNFVLKHNLKYNIKHAKKIVTVSNYSKQDIIKEFKINENKILVSYPPIKNVVKGYESSNLEYKDYFLFVSASRYTKNTLRGIMAIDELYRENETRKTIIVGDLSDKIKEQIEYKNNYIFLKYIPEYDLEYLYKNAYLFIFPSLAEGFGSPPLEAMRYGTNVVCSKEMSMSEIYSKYLVLFDPYKVEDIKNGIKKAIRTYQKDHILKGYNEITKIQEENLCELCNYLAKGEGQ